MLYGLGTDTDEELEWAQNGGDKAPNNIFVSRAVHEMLKRLGYRVYPSGENYNYTAAHVTPIVGAIVARLMCLITGPFTVDVIHELVALQFAETHLRANALTDEGHAALALFEATPFGQVQGPGVTALVNYIKQVQVQEK